MLFSSPPPGRNEGDAGENIRTQAPDPLHLWKYLFDDAGFLSSKIHCSLSREPAGLI